MQVTPLEGRWRVESGDMLVETEHFEYAIAQVLGLDESDAIPIASRLMDEYLEEQVAEAASA